VNDWTQSRSIERARDIPPQVTLTPPPPPPPQPVVVDRVQFLQEQAEQRRLNAERERQLADLQRLAYQRPELLRQQIVERTGRDEFERRLQGVLAELIPMGIATGEQGRNQLTLERMRNVRVQDFYDQTTGSEAERRQQAYDLASQEALRRSKFIDGVKLIPRENDPIFGSAAKIYTTKVPGLENVRQQAGEIGRAIGERTGLPGAGAVGEFVGEAAVPVRTWEVAADILGGNIAVDVTRLAARRLLTAAQDAGFELTEAGLRKFVSTETGGRILRALQSERGALEPEKVVSSLEEQRQNITRALKVLRSGEAVRVRGGTVTDAFKVAERYETGSEQREALLQVIAPKIQNLPASAQKFIRESIRVLPSKTARKAATEAQRARQFIRGSEAFDEATGTVEERVAASFGAFRGGQDQRFTPIGNRFSDEETAELMDEIVKASEDGRIGRVFDRNRTVDSLNLLLTGNRLPGSTRGLNLEPGEIKMLGKVFGPEFEAALPKTPEHLAALKTLVDWINLPRALVTALDFSAAGRQGIVLAARNPIEWGKSIAPMIRAMASEEGFDRAGRNLRGNKKYEDAIRHGLDFADIGGGAAGEEPFVSRLASKIPFIKGSERGYVMFLDTLRMLTYEKYATRAERLAQKQGWDVERLDLVKMNVAKFLNVASGRGDLKAAGEFVPALNAVFFSPRFVVSRFQSVWAMVRPGQDAFTRQIAFENLGAFVGTGTGMLLAAKAMGADIEVDPRSSDFGKMRFGNTRIDFWGGFQPIARYIAQLATAERKELFTGDKVPVYPGTTALRFFRSKLAPGGSMIYDYTVGEGKTYNGDDVFFKEPGWQSAWSDFGERILPLSIQDAIEGYRTGGAFGAAAGGGVSAVGGGISSFEASERQKKEIADTQIERELADAGFPDVGRDFESNAEMRVVVAQRFNIDAEQARKFDSLDEMREFLYERDVPIVAKARGVSEAIAKQLVSQGITNALRPIYDNAQKARLEWMRNNPDDAKKAAEAGLLGDLSKDEREILGID